ncbi:hypothetical protein I8748_27635 [Nostoc sp. CENA67]|uniref:Uncharacterized protein n=1 Tax=Amazonocrinis nigriterrae CENA67 TaxID=2794033 RepID=A0A8J7L9R2_9NOST|nr:hypothetical protein [Amazonocrinis nigriterrae]MBH8565894.1 hypothetical protein [Amazonocrinis nigriterrae CENA67]
MKLFRAILYELGSKVRRCDRLSLDDIAGKSKERSHPFSKKYGNCTHIKAFHPFSSSAC